jgi:predicted nucleic acid-binding protein
MEMIRTSTGTNHFLDTNVVLRHANSDDGAHSGDIARILEDAENNKRRLWISSVLFGELRPSSFAPGKFASVNDLAKYIRSIATVIAPDPNIMMAAARLRDIRWNRVGRQRNEKPRTISLGDAIHLSSAIFVRDVVGIEDIEFLTFDDGRSETDELDDGTSSLSILRLEDYTDGIGSNQDVAGLVRLPRMRPILSQQNFAILPSRG